MWISPILAAFVVSLTLASFTGCTLSTRNSKLKAIKKALTGETPTSLSDPTSLIVTSKSTSQISLAWADVSLDETSYEIERCGGLACTDFVPVSGLSPLAADASAASDTSIAPSTYYSFRVRAVSTKGSSAWLVKADIAPAATRLVFSTSPSASNTASFNFATQPVINASDSASDTDTDYTTTISLAAYTDAGCLTAATGTLSSGTLSPTGGVSTFTGINYTQSGSFYFKATSGTLTAACSPAFSVAPGSVSLLAFTVSPSSTNTAGSNFATQPKVAARDAANNLANSYTGGVTISPYTDVGCLTSATGTLSGAVISASGGIATFTALNYSDLAGTYYLKAVSGAASSACTSAFTLANGAATQLVYGAQPGPSATVSTNVVTNPTVTAKDAGGNPLSGYSTVMTLSAYTDVGCLTAATGTLTGRTATPSSGIATYATLKYNTSGNIYLRATSGSLTAACSSLLTVSNAATKLAFVTAPSATNTAAIDFATQPIVAAQDSGSVTVPTYSSDVTLAIYTNVACTTAAGGGVLNGAPATASGGLATFSGVNYSAAGTYYLRASSGALTTACSSAFTIAIGAASKLAFLTMPTAYVGSPIFPYISVQAQDAGGNLVTSYTSSVTVAIATNPSAGTLSGTLSSAAVSGTSLFGTLNINNAGVGYTLSASASGLTSATSAAFDVINTAPPLVAASRNSACSARGSSQNIYCWGDNRASQSGTVTTSAKIDPPSSPVKTTATFSTLLTGATDLGAATNGNHLCVVTGTGGVRCWGDNGNGQIGDNTTTSRNYAANVVDTTGSGTLTGIAQVSPQAESTCARSSVGNVYCWGRGDSGQVGHSGYPATRAYPKKILGVGGVGFLSSIDQITGGYNFACARNSSNAVFCWGNDNVGQFGDNGAAVSSSNPVQTKGVGGVGFVAGATDISAGDDHACAVVAAGKILCWGGNAVGQLGRGTTTAKEFPAYVRNTTNTADLTGAVSVSAGLTSTCAILAGGTVYCWGYNSSGQLGNANSGIDTNLPVQVHGVGDVGFISGITQLACGGIRTCATDSSAVSYCWGWGAGGGLGDNNSGVDAGVPVVVQGITNSAKVVTAHTVSCLLKSNGDVVCFGRYGSDYLLNSGQTANDLGYDQLTPQPTNQDPATGSGTFAGATGVWSTGVDSNSFCATTSGGTAYCWGDNSNGQLGDNTYADRLVPTAVVSTTGTGTLANVTKIVPGPMTTCAMTSTNAAYCWGRNEYGQIGFNTTTPDTAPIRKPKRVKGVGGVGNLASVTDISAGYQHSCAVNSGGSVYCWGLNTNGQLGDNTTTQRNAPVQVLGVGGAGFLSGIARVHAGNQFTCAVATSGGVYCWGLNTYGQLGDNTLTQRKVPVQVLGIGAVGNLTDIVKITGASQFVCAVSNTGRAFCWGENGYGNLGDNTYTLRKTPVAVLNAAGSAPMTDIMSAAAGSIGVCYVQSSGVTYCVGSDNEGQLGANAHGVTPLVVPVVGLP